MIRVLGMAGVLLFFGSLSAQNAAPVRSRTPLAWQQQRGWLKQGGGWQYRRHVGRRAAPHAGMLTIATWTQRGGYGGSYIPQAGFRSPFRRSASLSASPPLLSIPDIRDSNPAASRS